MVTTEQTLKSSTTEVKTVKTQLQALQIELQSQLGMVRPTEPGFTCTYAVRRHPAHLIQALLSFLFHVKVCLRTKSVGFVSLQKASLEATLADTQNRYSMQLSGYQMQVGSGRPPAPVSCREPPH